MTKLIILLKPGRIIIAGRCRFLFTPRSTRLMRDAEICRVSAFAKYIFDEKIFHGLKPHLLLTGSKLNESLLQQCQLCYGRGALLGEFPHSEKIRDEHGLWRREHSGWLSCLEAGFVDHVRQVEAVCTSSQRTVQPAGNSWDFAENPSHGGEGDKPRRPLLAMQISEASLKLLPSDKLLHVSQVSIARKTLKCSQQN